jgi:ATP adenylyltransferase
MDYVWSPWRYRYIAGAGQETGCIFCQMLAANDDAGIGILLRGDSAFVVLNKFPYTSGHLMIVPYAHGGELPTCSKESLSEMMGLAQRMQSALESVYHPRGYNLGMNLGQAAGAGVVGHLHMHLLPRWPGDANFMTTIGETRVEPEDLSTTYAKLRGALGLK